MKTKITNFILETSQVLLVFLGGYSAIMCATQSLSLPVNRMVTALVMLGTAFLFYGLFTVLETFRHGKLYGLLGITLFTAVVILRFRSVMQKGFVTIVNTYLKEFMNYTQSSVTLMSNRGFEQETASVEYCTTLVVIVIAAYLTAVVSSTFYRKRRSSVFVAATVLFFVVPLTVGKIGSFGNVMLYILTTMAVVGTRFLRFDTTDKRMRQKLSLVLICVGIIAGGVTYLFVTPKRYENHLNDIVEIKNSALAMTTWGGEDFTTFVREYFSGDALEYGRVGKTKQVSRTGKTLFKISGDFEKSRGLYLKGYTGSEYSQNRWRQIKNEQFQKEREELLQDGLSLDNWHVTLRNQIGDSQTTGNPKLWSTGKITVKNLAFGFGNYVTPYFPTTSFSYGTGNSYEEGKSTAAVPGVQFEAEYFPVLYSELKRGVIGNQYKLADNEYWTNNRENRNRLSAFAKEYYLGVPEETNGVIREYKNYLNAQGNLLDKYNEGSASLYEVIQETRNFIMMDTKYTLSPGRTPKDQDAVVYFLKENKKGYSPHYATAAAVLLRGIGVPTRFVEGLYISKEQLADVMNTTTEIEVTDEDIHAWVEVYQENYGFVPFEFTPGRGDDDAKDSSVADEDDDGQGGSGNGGAGGASDGSTAGDHTDMKQPPAVTATPVPQDDMTFENIESDNYNREDEMEDDTADTESDGISDSKDKKNNKNDKAASGQGRMKWWQITLLVLGGIVLLLLVAEIQRRVRIVIFKRNVRKKVQRKQILAYYRHLEKAFANKGISYRGQSVDEYTRQIAEAYDMKEEIIHSLVAMVFCASFSCEKFDKAQIAEFRTAYRSIRHKVYEGVRGVMKLYYMYVLCL